MMGGIGHETVSDNHPGIDVRPQYSSSIFLRLRPELFRHSTLRRWLWLSLLPLLSSSAFAATTAAAETPQAAQTRTTHSKAADTPATAKTAGKTTGKADAETDANTFKKVRRP